MKQSANNKFQYFIDFENSDLSKSKMIVCCRNNKKIYTNSFFFKGRFLEFRKNHDIAYLFSKMSGSTFYKEISKFQ